MIKIKNVSKKYADRLVLNGISLQLEYNQKALIMGQNGAGKTTLMRAILGELTLNSGEILIGGIDPKKDRKAALKKLSFVPQIAPALHITLSELCEYAIKTGGADLDNIKHILNRLDFEYENEAKKPFIRLSGGMKQKVLIAIALARSVEITMFDEPTANLDALAREQFWNLLKSEYKNRAMLFISHRKSELGGVANRAIEMDLGRVIADEILSGDGDIKR